MGYLRLVHSAEPRPAAPESSCLEAYDRELDYLFETLQRLGAGPREVEDLAQEVFVVLHRNWPTLDRTRPLRPYLFGIAFRVVCAHRRRRTREIPHPALDAEDAGRSPEGHLQNKESVALLMAALECVPLPRRAVLVMHELDGAPIPEVASALDVPLNTAYSRLRLARRDFENEVQRLEGKAA